MTRTEDDLRAMYRAEPTLDAERHVADWVRHELVGIPSPRRGTAAKWAAPLAAAAAVAVAAAVIAATSYGGSRSDQDGAAAPASGSASPSAVPASASASAPAPAAMVSLTAQAAQQTLLDLLPRKGSVTNRAGAADADQALTELTFDDGHGAAGMDLSVTFAAGGGEQGGWPCASADHGGTCSTVPGGSQLFTLQTYEYPDRRVDTREWVVAALRPDGMLIEISEWNAPTEKDTPVSRPAPPFTIAELTTVVTSPAWTPTISAARARKDAGLFTPDDRLAPPGEASAARSAAAARRAAASARAKVTPDR